MLGWAILYKGCVRVVMSRDGQYSTIVVLELLCVGMGNSLQRVC